MIRRLIILTGTLCVLLLAFGVYQLVSGKVEWPELFMGPVRGPEMPPPRQNVGRLDVEELRWVYLEQRGPEGQLEAIYMAANWDKGGEGQYLLTRPVYIRYLNDGQRIYVAGDRGEVFADRVAGGYDIRKGHLFAAGERKVRIYIDRATTKQPPRVLRRQPDSMFGELEKRPEDVIRIQVDDITFDNELLALYTDSDLLIWSSRVDLIGRGLDIRWNDRPQELRSLTVKQGQYMAVYNISDEMDLLSLPGARREKPAGPREGPSAPAAPTGPAGATGPSAPTTQAQPPAEPPEHLEIDRGDATIDNRPPAAGAGPPPTVTTPPLAAEAAAATEPVWEPLLPWEGGKFDPWLSPADTQPSTAPTTGPTPAAPAAEDIRPPAPTIKKKNIFQAIFHGSVNVDYGQRYMHQAKSLSLTFEWDSETRRQELTRRRRPEKAAPVSTRPARPRAPRTRPSTRPAPKRSSQPVLLITWTGPLTLTPIGYTPDPSGERYLIEGDGRQVLLSDAQATADCRRFEYHRPAQVGELGGTDAKPVVLTLSRGQTIACSTMRFDRTNGKADLIGPGRMTAKSLREGFGPDDTGGGSEATTAPAEAGKPDRISWARAVHAKFGEERTPREDGGARVRPYVREAEFLGDVELVQGETGNLVRCPRLKVWMRRSGSGRSVPTRAVAAALGKQRVYASQEGSDIYADQITVTFREKLEKSSEGPRRRVRPHWIFADGAVSVTDTQGDRKIVATGDRMETEVGKRTAVLKGNPARVQQNKNVMAGEVIYLDQLAESARVAGPGALAFRTKRGSGSDGGARPRKVDIEWKGGMEYDGKRNVARFIGTVELRSRPVEEKGGAPQRQWDEMDCGELQVQFEKVARADKGEQDKAAAADKPRSDRRFIGMEEYSRRRMTKVTARKGVVLRSHVEDDQGRLERRLKMMADDRLVYDVRAEEIGVDGPGTLVNEDYRPPKQRQRRSRPEQAMGNLERPMQTLFQWKESMELSQVRRRVVLKKDVVMVNRSGGQISHRRELNTVPLPADLGKGRITAMTCQELLAQFGEPEEEQKEPTTQPADKGDAGGALVGTYDLGPKLGPLDLFRAQDKVNLKDGPWQLIGGLLVYERVRDIVVLWGNRPDERKANASVYYEDRQKSQSRSWSSPKIYWYRKTNKIRTEAASGIGGG